MLYAGDGGGDGRRSYEAHRGHCSVDDARGAAQSRHHQREPSQTYRRRKRNGCPRRESIVGTVQRDARHDAADQQRQGAVGATGASVRWRGNAGYASFAESKRQRPERGRQKDRQGPAQRKKETEGPQRKEVNLYAQHSPWLPVSEGSPGISGGT